MDPAFKSRIDLTLAYSNLGFKARRKVWLNFINKLPKRDVEVKDSEISELAKTLMNGREIKSSIKTAWVLAAKDKPLRMCHFKAVLDNRRRTESINLEYGEHKPDDESLDEGDGELDEESAHNGEKELGVETTDQGEKTLGAELTDQGERKTDEELIHYREEPRS